MIQKWYKKASVQAAIVNAIPNLVIASIGIASLIASIIIYKSEVKRNQSNFESQILRDSINNIKQGLITDKNQELLKLQLESIKKQYLNDSINKMRELQITEKELEITLAQNNESKFMTNQNLEIGKISFLRYRTKYQKGDLDSIFGFSPDFIYENQDNLISDSIELISSLSLLDLAKLDIIKSLPMLRTKEEAENYIIENRISVPVQIVKQYTIIVEFKNITKFPITLLNTKNSHIFFENLGDSTFQIPHVAVNQVVVYPEEKSSLSISFCTSTELKLDHDFIINLSLDYSTIYGRQNKKLRAKYFSDEKEFVIFN